MTQVTYPDLADPASSKIFRIISITKYFEKYFKSTFEIFRNYFRNISKLKYFEIYFKIFRNILHMRNLSKDFAVTQNLSKDFGTINLLMLYKLHSKYSIQCAHTKYCIMI